MNYSETLAYLYAQLPMYQRVGAAAYKKDLGNTIALCDSLNNPQNTFPTIHIAGTNGKGSTSHMIASILQEAGYKTGLYTSPHLVDFRERIRVNGKMISEGSVCDFVQRIKPELEAIEPSFFEITVAMAFDHFQKEKVDIAVIETGLGGRLDSTNILTPMLSVITNIGMDHADMLGDTLQLIAGEKAGIIKKEVPVVIGEFQEEVYPIFEKKAQENNSPLIQAWENHEAHLPSDLIGFYQLKNKKTTLTAIRELQKQGLNISQNAIEQGLLKVSANTGLLGRWQILNQHPKVICDTGHNAEGLQIVMQQLKNERTGNLQMVFGQVTGKDLNQILLLLPKDAKYYFCKPSIPRGMPVELLLESARASGLTGSPFESVEDAVKEALSQASAEDTLFVGGSTFVVADLLTCWNGIPVKI